jgi:tRNA (adenine57-N1/adenine58-N1)-methyltransferase
VFAVMSLTRCPSAEFESHGLSNVHLQHRNVCKDGFGDVSGVEAGK